MSYISPFSINTDKTNQLIYQYLGYHSSVKDELTDKILRLITK